MRTIEEIRAGVVNQAPAQPKIARKTRFKRIIRRVLPTSARVAYTIRRWRSAVLVTSAFGMLDLAAYGFSTIAGHAAVGVSLLVLNSIAGEERR